jgi:hypothetical protein
MVSKTLGVYKMKTFSKGLFGLLAVVMIVVTGLAFLSPVSDVAAAGLERWGGPGRGTGSTVGTPGTGLALTPLSDAEKTALQEAILEEYGALNLYDAVIDQFGSVYPFSTIVRAEQTHVNALVKQAVKYGVEVPANPGLAVSFDTLADACSAGVEAEIADAALYDDLKLVTTHTDLLRVYDRLQSASLNQHLPAFEACQ